MAKVYSAEIVGNVQHLYRDAPVGSFATTYDMAVQHAAILLNAHQSGNRAATTQISNWHPALVSKPAQFILDADFSTDDALTTICRELGYTDGNDARDRSAPIDVEFERCVDLALAGELDALAEGLDAAPRLVTQTSPFGHAATLLIYLAANGVEMWRQVVPENVAGIAEMLILRGADRQATANVYGGQFDVIALTESSAHPNEAGVGKALIAACR